MNTVMPCSERGFQKPLLLYASPHENGNTRRLVEQIRPFLPVKAEIEEVKIFDLQIRPCTDCRICYRKECPLNDDGMGELLCRIEAADLLITAAPVYFNGLPSPMKAILDRTQQLFIKKFVQKKLVFSRPKAGILLTTSGSDDPVGNQDGSLSFRPISAALGVRESIRMFYGCLGTRLLSHIAVAGTDRVQDFSPDPGGIADLKRAVSAYLETAP